MLSQALMIVKLIPALIEVVQAVEKMFPEKGLGAEKLAMVREMLTTAYQGLEEAWPAIEKVVEVIVGFANKLGVFKKGE